MKRAERRQVEELSQLLDAGTPPHDTAAGEGLRGMLVLADHLRDVPLATPDPAFRQELRASMLTWEPATRPAERARAVFDQRTARVRNSLRAGVAGGVAATLLGTTGVAFAAQQALPGETLYDVKLATEAIRLRLASGDASDGRLLLGHADERLEEVTALTTAGSPDLDLTLDTLGRLDDDAVAGTESLLRAFLTQPDDAITVLLEEFTANQLEGLRAIETLVPTAALPAVRDTQELMRRIDVRVTEVTSPCEACGADPAAIAPAGDSLGPIVSMPGEGPAAGLTAPCNCGGGSRLAPVREDAPQDGETPVTPDDGTVAPASPPPADGPAPTTPSEPPEDPVLELPEVLDPVVDGVGDGVDDVVDGITEGTDPLPDPVEEPVDDGAEGVGDLVDDLLGD